MMKFLNVGLVMVMAITILAGCGGGGQDAPPDAVSEETVYTSEVLDVSYDDALAASSQLTLGTLNLEGTENAVTPEQATALLPLWQALQGGVTAQAEVDAVLKQIEGTMTQEQLAAITAMQLTREDMRAWMEAQGINTRGGFPGAGEGQELSKDERATRQAEFGRGEEGGMPPEMATRRAEFADMSEEDREALRATMEAGGGRPGGAGGMPGGAFRARQFVILLNPLIEMLTVRAAE
ncbi:MAG: hypothetical protein GY832_40680 [Chloroflexi bacterium]|nr:hypothetical protein [Chloroflexota bacterium]